MNPLSHNFGEKHLKTAFFHAYSPLKSRINYFFRRAVQLKRCALSVIHNHAKIGKILIFGEKASKVRKIVSGYLVPCSLGLRFFQKNFLAETMHHIVLYNQAKNWKEPYSRFGEKAMIVKKNFGHLILCNPGLRFFQKNLQLKQCALLSYTIMKKIGKIFGAALEKRPKNKNNNIFWSFYPL